MHRRSGGWRTQWKRSGKAVFERIASQIVCVTLFGAVPTYTASNALAQGIPSELPALRFFLDEPPASALAGLPSGTRGAFIAKVRVVDVSGFNSRLSPGEDPPPPRPYSRLGVVEVTATLHGRAPACRRSTTGCHLFVEFGSNLPQSRTVYPLKPDREERQYYVVSFYDKDRTLTLLGFPVPEAEYTTWRKAYLDWITRPPTMR